MNKILFLFFLFFGHAVVAQETLNFPEVNKTTYDYYLRSEWKPLIALGKKSLNEGIDFYYLQVRMGVAYFKQNKFRQAIKHLENANKINPKDDFVTAYLYKAYRYANREADARKMTRWFSIELKESLEIPLEVPIFSKIYLESKLDYWDDYQIAIASTDELEQKIRKNFNYLSINFENYTRSDAKIFWGYSGVWIANLVYKLDESSNPIRFNQNVKQNQLYFKYTKQFAQGSSFSVALNYIYFKLDDRVLINTSGNTNIHKKINITRHDVVGNLSFSKDFSLFNLGANTSFSALNEFYQIQPGINLTYYPFGNTNLYLTSSIIQQFEYGSEELRKDRIYSQAIGFRVSKFYIEPYMSWGKLANYTQSHAFIIVNDIDFIQDKKGIKLYAYLLKNRLNIYAEYQQYNKINSYKLNGIENTINYNYQSIIGGITWNF